MYLSLSSLPPLCKSVYVVTEQQMAEYKRANTEAEIAELEKLVDGHRSSITSLQVMIDKLKGELPQTSEAE